MQLYEKSHRTSPPRENFPREKLKSFSSKTQQQFLSIGFLNRFIFTLKHVNEKKRKKIRRIRCLRFLTTVKKTKTKYFCASKIMKKKIERNFERISRLIEIFNHSWTGQQRSNCIIFSKYLPISIFFTQHLTISFFRIIFSPFIWVFFQLPLPNFQKLCNHKRLFNSFSRLYFA